MTGIRADFSINGDKGSLAAMLGLLLAWAFVLASGQLAMAADLDQPKGRVILTVEGNLSKSNGDGKARLDREMLMAIGMKTITTNTLYSTKPSTYSGVLMRDLLDHLGAKGDKIDFLALDDYRTEAPTGDYYKFDVLLALEKDGKPLSIRMRGPSRIIYPIDQNPELRDKIYASRMVWQIKRMIVK